MDVGRIVCVEGCTCGGGNEEERFDGVWEEGGIYWDAGVDGGDDGVVCGFG